MKEGKYIVFADHRFAKEADRELQNLFHAAYTGEKAEKNAQFFMASIDGDRDRTLSAIKAGKLSFVDIVIPIDAELNHTEDDYKNMTEKIGELLDKRRTFKIEVKRVKSILSDRAKSIEVKIGSVLEAEGFKPDLTNPDMIVYAVLLNDKTDIGVIEKNQTKDYLLDHFRSAQKEHEDRVNRAEFKLEEAVEFFDIDLSRTKLALDMGAAPGGWTHYLITRGIKVVAIDNALLDYEKLCKDGKVIVLTSAEELAPIAETLRNYGIAFADIDDASIDLGSYSVIHIKMNSKHIKESLLDMIGRFDLLTIDTNTEVQDSAEIAESLADRLNAGADLIMTIKLFHRNVERQIATAEAGLRSYEAFKIKKLTHNREELTLHAVRRDMDQNTD